MNSDSATVKTIKQVEDEKRKGKKTEGDEKSNEMKRVENCVKF